MVDVEDMTTQELKTQFGVLYREIQSRLNWQDREVLFEEYNLMELEK